MTQFSLFGAATAAPALADLDGLLLAGGWWVRQDQSARLSVIVPGQWRAAALTDEFTAREVGCAPGEAAVTEAENGLCVRTGFHPALLSAAAAWTRGASQGPPPELELTPGGLRLWCLAAGHREDAGYLLATAEPDGAIHTAAGAQLARHGIAAISVTRANAGHGHGYTGPGWRISSAKRLHRLAELVGPPPHLADPAHNPAISAGWPAD